jgi:flagellar hook-length control protein FliK
MIPLLALDLIQLPSMPDVAMDVSASDDAFFDVFNDLEPEVPTDIAEPTEDYLEEQSEEDDLPTGESLVPPLPFPRPSAESVTKMQVLVATRPEQMVTPIVPKDTPDPGKDLDTGTKDIVPLTNPQRMMAEVPQNPAVVAPYVAKQVTRQIDVAEVAMPTAPLSEQSLQQNPSPPEPAETVAMPERVEPSALARTDRKTSDYVHPAKPEPATIAAPIPAASNRQAVYPIWETADAVQAKQPDAPTGFVAPQSSDMPNIAAAAPKDQMRQIVPQIIASVTIDKGVTEIALSPAELGKVRLNMSMQDGLLALQIMAERPETADLMRRHIDQLAQEFRALGFHDLAFSFGDGKSDKAAPKTPQSAPETETGLVDELSPIPAQSPARQGLDLRL